MISSIYSGVLIKESGPDGSARSIFKFGGKFSCWPETGKRFLMTGKTIPGGGIVTSLIIEVQYITETEITFKTRSGSTYRITTIREIDITSTAMVHWF